jgi:hypothetical protein
MRTSVPRYESGEEIRIGDRVAYAGAPGSVVFVNDTRSYSAGYPEEHWSYLGKGFMIEARGWGLVYLNEPDEDLVLTGRS